MTCDIFLVIGLNSIRIMCHFCVSFIWLCKRPVYISFTLERDADWLVNNELAGHFRIISSFHLNRRIYVARGVILAEVTPKSCVSLLVPAPRGVDVDIARRSHQYSKFPERLMIFRDICRVSWSSSYLTLPASVAPKDTFKNSLGTSRIISTSPDTSWRRQCGGFIHRSVYFRFRPAPTLSTPFRRPRFPLTSADLTCCYTDASCPIYSSRRNARYYFRHSIPLSFDHRLER